MLMLYADTRLGGVTQWVYGDPREDYLRTPSELLNCVCFVCTKVRGDYICGGTAFFLALRTGGFQHIYAVTAAHVLKEIEKLGTAVYLRINHNSGQAQMLEIRGAWFFPDSEAVDLAILPLNIPRGSGLQFEPIRYENLVRPNDAFSFQDFGPGAEIILTGLFAMRSGTQRNYPIVRSGIVAAMPGEPLIDDDSGKPYDAYLIEARSFGGLSGSPVFVVKRSEWRPEREDGNYRRLGGAPVMSPEEYHLLGVIRGHWDLKQGPLVPAFNHAFAEVNMGIAVVTPALDLHQLMSTPKVREDQRERQEQHEADNRLTLD